MKRLLLSVLAATSVASVAETASAQVFTPTYQAPRSSSDLGLYLTDDGPGDLAIEGILRRGFGGYDVGLRGGIADTPGLSVLLGADLRNPLTAGTAPIDLAFTGGLQAILSDVRALGIQGGLSIGHTFMPAAGGFSVTPYVHPRVALVDWGGPADGFDAELLAEVGLDFAMRSGLSLRVGISLSDPGSDWGIGLAWR